MSKVTIHERKKKEQNGKEWRLMNRCGVSGLQGCWLGWPLKLLGLFANFQLCESALNYRTSLTDSNWNTQLRTPLSAFGTTGVIQQE
jgi:hypothetical protein